MGTPGHTERPKYSICVKRSLKSLQSLASFRNAKEADGFAASLRQDGYKGVVISRKGDREYDYIYHVFAYVTVAKSEVVALASTYQEANELCSKYPNSRIKSIKESSCCIL